MSRGILKTQFIHIYLLFLIRILKPKNHSQFFVNLGRIVAMRIPNKRKAAGRKKNRLMVLIECVIMVFFIMLWIFYPNTVVRNLTITLNPEENRIVYYVPGNLISAEVSSDQVTYELKTEEYENGNILSVSINAEHTSSDLNALLTVTYQYSGPAAGRQLKFTQEMLPIQWAREYSAYQYPDYAQGYYFASLQKGETGAGHYRVGEVSDDSIKMLFLYIAVGAFVVLCLDPSRSQPKTDMTQRKRHPCYMELNRFIEEYVQNYDERDIPAKYTSWVKRRIQIHNIIQNCLCRLLIFFPVTGGLIFHASILHVIIYELIFLCLWLISCIICVWSSLRLKNKNISNLFQTRPCLAIWCEYKLRNFAGDEYRWSIAALTFPAYMTKNQTFVESAFMADRIWKLYHRKNKGIYHLQYHYIQFCNFHYLGNEFIAQYHLEMINTELNNVPRVFIYKKYYAAVQRKVDLILDDAP